MWRHLPAMHFARRLTVALLGAALATGITMTPGAATGPRAPQGPGVDQVDHLRPVATVNVTAMEQAPAVPASTVHHLVISPEPKRPIDMTASAAVPLDLGGSAAPKSSVVSGGDSGGWNGISSIDMETGGTGAYAGTNGTLEPPDQGLCSGAGFVIEAVNDALRIYDTSGHAAKFKDVDASKSIPLAQFFNRAAGGTSGPTDFMSDPRCLFDHATQRWFVTILDLTSVPAYPAFNTDQNFIAVSKTNDPRGDWTIFSFDVTDNGMNGSPMHTGCVGPPVGATTLVGCLGDQPTLGTDANGIYITDNEYAFAEVFPVALPVGPPLQQIPVLRSGVAQLYALSKKELVSGSDTTLVRFDSDSIPFPGPAEDSPWQSISPASPVANDTTPEPAEGVEYLLSSVGLPVGHNANQIVVWAWDGTASLNSGNPNLTLSSVTINTLGAADTFFAPDGAAPSSQPFGAYQKDGPHPLAAGSGDPEEELNANDDRMNWVTLSGGTLWTNINTLLPADPTATGHTADNRVGIMYFQVRPSLVGGVLAASMVRDGYVQVPDNNVLFGSIGPRVDGATVMSFTLAGVDYFPSQAWARLDGLAPGEAPVVHVAHLGAAPEDGFTGLGLLGGQGIGAPDVPPCGPCVARWGDYSAAQIDESGCFWGANEWIPTGTHDGLGATDWGTGIVHVCPPPVHAAVAAATTTTGTVPLPEAAAAPATAPATALPNTSPSSPVSALVGALAALSALVAVSAIRRRRGRRAVR